MDDGELFDPEHATPFGDERRFLLFGLAEVELAIELSRLEEIVEPGPITRAPGAPPWVLGALNLRGLALPVIDLARKLGLAVCAEAGRVPEVLLDPQRLAAAEGARRSEEANETPASRPAILIFRPAEGAARLGVWVTNVLGFVEVEEKAISAAPRFDGAIPSDLLDGLVGLGDRFVPILDLSAATSAAAAAG